jgi:4-aminobutyrate--pyruvate transaminase
MVQMRAQEHGLICRAMGDNVALCPPLVISESEIGDMFKRFTLALDDVTKALGRQGLASVA